MLSQERLLRNRYRIDRLHELGAVETIYLGWDISADKAVMVSETKSQPNLLPGDLDILKEQFHKNAQKLCDLNHPHLIPPCDYFITDGPPIESENLSADQENLCLSYVITPLINFDSLMQRINKEGAITERDVIQWTDHILQALIYTHKLGILHGDIRPHNIYISPDSNALLTQFEVPSLWQPADPRKWTAKRVLGTPDYEPPERWALRIGQIDECSDLYSLGATMFHALTGQIPLSAEERTANPYSFQEVQISNININPHLKTVITKSLAVSKEKRYRNAGAMARALRSSRSQTPYEVKPAVPTLFPPEKHKRFSLSKFAGLLISTILLFIAASTGMWINTIISPGSTLINVTGELPDATPAIPSPTPLRLSTNIPTATPTLTPMTTFLEATPVSIREQPAITQSILISDTFESNTYGWPLSDHQDEWGSIIRVVESGVYVWKIGAEQDVGRWCLPDSDSYGTNFSLSVDIQRTNGPLNMAYGLIVRHYEGQYYVFNAREDGYFRFSLWQGSEWVSIIDWTETLSIKPGEINHLEINVRDSTFEFYINDIYVGEAVDDEISAGDNGLSAIVLANPDIATLEFDNFTLFTDNPR